MNREKDIEEILKKIDEYNLKDCKCYEILKAKLHNDSFINIVKKGLLTSDIKGIPGIILEHLEKSMGPKEFNEYFQNGYNIGNCTGTSKRISYVLQGSHYICGGLLPLIKGTKNSIDGTHTWIEYGDYIIDPTLMIMISSKYKDIIGYIEENKYNPEEDDIYNTSLLRTEDASLKRR